MARGDAEAAILMLRDAVDSLESTWGPGSPDLIPVLEFYRTALEAQGSTTDEIDTKILDQRATIPGT